MHSTFDRPGQTSGRDLGITELAAIFKERKVIWFEDNTAVLSGLVRGCSSHAELDTGVASIHMLLAVLEARCWFEWIESKANWSDEASRQLLGGSWAADNNFHMRMGSIPSWPWKPGGPERVQQVAVVAAEQRWPRGAAVAQTG